MCIDVTNNKEIEIRFSGVTYPYVDVKGSHYTAALNNEFDITNPDFASNVIDAINGFQVIQGYFKYEQQPPEDEICWKKLGGGNHSDGSRCY